VTIAHLLEDFSSLTSTPQSQFISDEVLEEYRLEAFENGYKSGWDDASRAHEDGQSSIATELGQNLRDLSFTYHEARDHLIRALAPLFQTVITTLVPPLADNGLAAHVALQLGQLAGENSDAPIEISVAPENQDKITRLLDPTLPMTVNVVPDSTLGEGQATLTFGNEEREIDISDIVENIIATLGSFTNQSMEASKHD